MIKYTIDIEGSFITFVGYPGSSEEGKKISHKKSLIKKVLSDDDSFLLLIDVDDTNNGYKYNEVINPATSEPFASMTDFRTYIITNLNI